MLCVLVVLMSWNYVGLELDPQFYHFGGAVFLIIDDRDWIFQKKTKVIRNRSSRFF